MLFYYFSLFSFIAYGVFVFIAIVLLWLVWTKLLRLRVRNLLYWVLIASIVIGPWGEELWIAYNFGRLCRKDAGLFIYKTAKVDGFYDDTTGWGPRQLAASGYEFVESRDILHKKLLRVERANEASRVRVLEWYAQHPSEAHRDNQYLVYPVSDMEQLVVSPNRVNVWRVTTISHPTARYVYKWISGYPSPMVAQKIFRHEEAVIDTKVNETLGRYVRYGRLPSWIYIGLGPSDYACDGPDGGPQTKHSLLIYREVLRPVDDR